MTVLQGAPHRWGMQRRVALAIGHAVFLALLLVSSASFAEQTRAGAHAPRVDTRAKLPLRKAGLWEVTVQSHSPAGLAGARQPPQTVLQCTNNRVESIMLLAILPGQENCQEARVIDRPKGKMKGYGITTVCRVHDQQINAQVTLQGDLSSVYSGTYSIDYPSAPQMNSGVVNFQGRWLGGCKPKQKPGDMVLPNGATVNVVNDIERAERHVH